VLFHVGAGMGM